MNSCRDPEKKLRILETPRRISEGILGHILEGISGKNPGAVPGGISGIQETPGRIRVRISEGISK